VKQAANTAANSIPPAALGRLTRYLAHVQELMRQGAEWVSSATLARALGLTSSTVRQDLTHITFSGISKRGYRVKGLERALSEVLGADRSWEVVVVGAGNLGRALALHEDFTRRGIHICGIFDNDRAVVGQRVGGLTVGGMQTLRRTVRKHGAAMGIIAVPAAAAQEVADALVAAGVKGLLNLTLTHIATPPGVPVIDSRIAAGLQELSHAIRNA